MVQMPAVFIVFLFPPSFEGCSCGLVTHETLIQKEVEVLGFNAELIILKSQASFFFQGM